MTTYKIIKNAPYDKDAPTTYWIQKDWTTFFGLIKRRKVFGEYTQDSTYGELGDMPFFTLESVNERLNILQNYGE